MPPSTEQAPPLLEIINLGVRCGRETPLDGVSLNVKRGTIHVLVGPNGAGKSTLIAGILGRIPFSGRIIATWLADGRIGYVPQSFAVDRSLPVTVADFLALARQRRPVCFGVNRETRERIGRLLARVGLESLAKSGYLPEDFQYPFLVRGVLCVLVMAPLLGGLSHLVVSRRMAFFSAALGNAALTGLSIALLLGEPLNAPYGGIFAFCLLSALGMVFVKRRTSLSPDTLIGVFLALTLGLGICLLVFVTRRFNIHQVESAMFGSLLTVTDGDLALLIFGGGAVSVLLAREYNGLLLESLSGELSGLEKVDSAYVEYLFAVLLTVAIVISLKVIGALLVEALVVVPAAAARNLAASTRAYLVWSVAIAFFAGIGGLGISTRLLVPTGGAVVLALSVLFFVTLAIGVLVRRWPWHAGSSDRG